MDLEKNMLPLIGATLIVIFASSLAYPNDLQEKGGKFETVERNRRSPALKISAGNTELAHKVLDALNLGTRKPKINQAALDPPPAGLPNQAAQYFSAPLPQQSNFQQICFPTVNQVLMANGGQLCQPLTYQSNLQPCIPSIHSPYPPQPPPQPPYFYPPSPLDPPDPLSVPVYPKKSSRSTNYPTTESVGNEPTTSSPPFLPTYQGEPLPNQNPPKPPNESSKHSTSQTLDEFQASIKPTNKKSSHKRKKKHRRKKKGKKRKGKKAKGKKKRKHKRKGKKKRKHRKRGKIDKKKPKKHREKEKQKEEE